MQRSGALILGAALAVFLFGSPGASGADDDAAWREARSRGWGYLMERLAADGVDRRRIAEVFADPRFPPFDRLEFRLVPGESRALYRGFLSSGSIERARMCRAAWSADLEDAERRYGVPASVITAILHVETGCGQNTGRSPILPALARLAMAGEPDNLSLNVARHTGAAASLDSEQAQPTIARARRIESMFYPEVRATFDLSSRLHVDPLEIRGSSSGAFGIPQFLPTSYLSHARDADGDGRISLYDRADAVASCANYLQAFGWRPGLSRSEQRTVLWNYNHSVPYIDTVLGVAEFIESPGLGASQRAAHTVRRSAKGRHGRGVAGATTKAKSKAKARSGKATAQR